MTLDLNKTKMLICTLDDIIDTIKNDRKQFLEDYFKLALTLSIFEFYNDKDNIIKMIMKGYDETLINNIIDNIDKLKDELSKQLEESSDEMPII